MFSRRPVEQHNRGRIPGGSLPTPLTLLGATTLQWVRSDLGVTNDPGVSIWADQSGNGLNYTAAAGARPSVVAEGLNGKPTILFNGTANELVSNLNLPAPGTTPFWMWFVVNQRGWTSAACLFSGQSSNVGLVQQITASPQVRLFNGSGVATNAGAAIDSWVVGHVRMSNQATDYLTLGATKQTGNPGNSDPGTNRYIGSRAGSLFCNIEVAEVLYANAEPSDAVKTALNNYAASQWGATVTLAAI